MGLTSSLPTRKALAAAVTLMTAATAAATAAAAEAEAATGQEEGDSGTIKTTATTESPVAGFDNVTYFIRPHPECTKMTLRSELKVREGERKRRKTIRIVEILFLPFLRKQMGQKYLTPIFSAHMHREKGRRQGKVGAISDGEEI